MLKVPTIDVVIRHYDDHTRERLIFIARDALSVPAIDHNLIPPFVMTEENINVRTAPKFEVEDASTDDHSACFPKNNLRMLLKLYGVFF